MADLTPIPPRSIAGIASFRDQAALHTALTAECALHAGRITLARLAPTRFLATGPVDACLPARLADALRGLAAVTDQSDMWAAWRVSGADSREHLARVVPVDLDGEMGDVVLTRAGHLDVRVCRVGADDYEIAVSRSFSADLRHALEEADRGLLL